LKHRFLDLVHIAYLDAQKAKMWSHGLSTLESSLFRLHTSILGQPEADIEFSMPFDHLKHLFFDIAEVVFCVCQKADNPVAGCVENKKHRIIDFNQVVIYGGQKAEIEFLGLFHHLKYRLIDFTKLAFCHIQKADNEFSGPFDHLKHRFFDLVQVAFLDAKKS
jgi:hypothetical protein